MPAGGPVELGRVAGVFGVHGWLRVESWTRPQENLLHYPDWMLTGASSGRFHLAQGRAHGPGIVVSLADEQGRPLDDRDRAAELVGAVIAVDRAALPDPGDDSCYWADLMDARVVNVQGESLGRVSSVIDNGAQDIMVVAGEDRQRLIPFVVGPIVRAVDVTAGVITVDWGLEY
ncbi:MAG TPA: ribosome maturation factor RimM [Nevskiaceae bacterium]